MVAEKTQRRWACSTLKWRVRATGQLAGFPDCSEHFWWWHRHAWEPMQRGYFDHCTGAPMGSQDQVQCQTVVEGYLLDFLSGDDVGVLVRLSTVLVIVWSGVWEVWDRGKLCEWSTQLLAQRLYMRDVLQPSRLSEASQSLRFFSKASWEPGKGRRSKPLLWLSFCTYSYRCNMLL